MDRFSSLFEFAARLDRAGIILTRIGLVVVLVWVGGLKAFHHEDEGIVPLVANSPLMNFFYRQPVGEYRQHMNREGDLVPANREWHERNGTYPFAYGLGSVIVAYGVMIALLIAAQRTSNFSGRVLRNSDWRQHFFLGKHRGAGKTGHNDTVIRHYENLTFFAQRSVNPWLPRVAAVGSFLIFVMSFVTLSFLITTPECRVPALGSPEHGFPLLSGAARLVVKDAIMMGAASVTMADSAKTYLRKKDIAPLGVSRRDEAHVGG